MQVKLPRLNTAALELWLEDAGFQSRGRQSILRYVRRHGTLAGIQTIRFLPGELAEAETILSGSQPPVPIDSPEWGSAGQGSMWRPLDDHWSLGGDPLFPRLKSASERRQDAIDVADWYHTQS